MVRQSLWVYLGGNISSGFGFIFWIIVAIYVSPSIVGSIAAVIALQTMLSSFTGFGFSAGLQRILGQTKRDGNFTKMKSRFFSSLKLQLVLGIPVVAILASCSSFGILFFGLTEIETSFVIILYVLSFWPPIIVATYRVFLRTVVPAAAQILSSILKIVICFPLLFLGLGFTGVISAIICATLISDIIIVIFVFSLFDDGASDKESTPISFYMELVKSGLPSWVPNTLTVIVESVGILLIYGLVSKGQTGLYSIAFAISMIVLSIPSSVHGMMFPVLSAMKQDREEAISRVRKIASIFTAPLAITLALYSIVPLSLFGPAYEPAFMILSVLVITALFSPLVSAYLSYAYALGLYSHVMLIGIAINLCRFILYIPLVSMFAALGAAIAFVLGAPIGVLLTVPLARRTRYRVDWAQYVTILLVPIIIALLLFYLNIHWLFGSFLLLAASFVFYCRLSILTRADVRGLLLGFFDSRRIDEIRKKFNPFKIDPNTICIEDIAHALSMLCRFAGHCEPFYTVCEHSIWMSMLAKKHKLKALIHDGSEAFLVDLPKPVKRHLKDYQKIEKNVQSAVYKKYGLDDSTPQEVSTLDHNMCYTEAKQLGLQKLDWGWNADELDIKLKCLSPKQAEKAFLKRFNELYTEEDKYTLEKQ